MAITLGKILSKFLGLILVTAVAIAVMFSTGTGQFGKKKDDRLREGSPVQQRKLAKAPVSVKRLKPERIEVFLTGTGMIRPFERYTLAFEIAGRIASLGPDAASRPLDEGGHVQPGQVLARLDQRVLAARKQETSARLEQAQDDLRRARQLKAKNLSAISDAEFQLRVTDLAIAKAQAAVAQKELEDATLISPVAGVISKRYVNPGESVNPRDPVFEIVQVDRLLLVIGVPESRVHELTARRTIIGRSSQSVRQAGQFGQPTTLDGGDLTFQAHVTLAGRDRYGRRWPEIDGQVYRISETADDKTGLFEVEILLSNRNGKLRPGQIATANLVIDRIQGYRLPLSSALFRDGKTYLFSVEAAPSDIQFMFWPAGHGPSYRARQYQIHHYMEQGSDLIGPHLPEQHHTVVVRGQHRLVDGQLVQIVPTNGSGSGVVHEGEAEDVPTVGTKTR